MTVPDFEDRLRRGLEGLAEPIEPTDAFDRIRGRRGRRRVARRVQTVGLIVAVLAGTIGGTLALARVFDSDRPRPPVGWSALTGNGRIAFVSDRDGNTEIYTVAPDGRGLRRITRDASTDVFPAWSPDGRELAFVRATETAQDVFVARADGSGARQLTALHPPARSTSVREGDPAWSPDGTRIAFAATQADSVQVWVASSDGTRARRLTDAPEGAGHPVWSPDGTRLAYSAPAGTAAGSLSIMAADGAGAHPILTDPPGTVDLLRAGSWSPDGTRLLLTRVERAVRSDRPPTSDVFVVGIDGSGLTRLTIDGTSSDAVWSPDGAAVVFVSAREGAPTIFVMDEDGSRQRSLGVGTVEAFGLAWQPVPPESAVPTPSVASPGGPSSSPSPHTPPSCDPTPVSGDFDGDGRTDTATVDLSSCLRISRDLPYALQVTWGGGASGIFPLSQCDQVCRALTVADLNADGKDELIVEVKQGASTTFVSVFELPVTEVAGDPATVAPPGSPPAYPPDQPFVADLGGSVTHQGYLTCDLTEGGTHQVIATSTQLSGDQTTWNAHETVFTFDVADQPPFGSFSVVSSRDYTAPFDPTGETQFEPAGSPCWRDGVAPTASP